MNVQPKTEVKIKSVFIAVQKYLQIAVNNPFIVRSFFPLRIQH